MMLMRLLCRHRQFDCRIIRPKASLARSRSFHHSLQDSTIPLSRSSSCLILAFLPSFPFNLRRRFNPYLPFDRLLRPPHKSSHRSSQGPQGSLDHRESWCTRREMASQRTLGRLGWCRRSWTIVVQLGGSGFLRTLLLYVLLYAHLLRIVD